MKKTIKDIDDLYSKQKQDMVAKIKAFSEEI